MLVFFWFFENEMSFGFCVLKTTITSDFSSNFRYCTSGDLVQLCPEGYYCPNGTGFDWTPCPIGTYSNDTGLYQESQCTACEGGYYCDSLHATAVQAQCTAGKCMCIVRFERLWERLVVMFYLVTHLHHFCFAKSHISPHFLLTVHRPKMLHGCMILKFIMKVYFKP